jgi:hypothetical protein
MHRIIPGLLLIAIGAVAFGIIVTGATTNPTVSALLARAYCQPGDTLRQVNNSESWLRVNNRYVSFLCSGDGREADVTLPVFFTMFGTLCIPLTLGILLVVAGAVAGSKRRLQETLANQVVTSPDGKTVTILGEPYNLVGTQQGQTRSGPVISVTHSSVPLQDLPPEKMQQIQDAINMAMGAAGQSWQMPKDDTDLADRLAQIKEARDKGLVTEEEYQALRKAILDRMK